MKITEQENTIIQKLLSFEHQIISHRLGFIEVVNEDITDELLNSSIGLLDRFSRESDERKKRIVITISALLWTYKKESWEGLYDFLIVILSRSGFSPSAIMIDDNYDSVNKQFSGLSSLISSLTVTLQQIEHEIFIKDKNFLITGFQLKVWRKMSTKSLLGISAPTSAGKSFIILLKAIEKILEKDGNIIYIVPTLSLVSQVSSDFSIQLKSFGLNHYRISTTYSVQEREKNKIYVLTQEKAITAFSQSENPFHNVRMLVVDEIQNIEKVANENDQRAKTLFDLLIEFRYTCEPELTVISGPRVGGLKPLGIDIFDENDADEEMTKDSPVASFTYSISQKRNKYFFNQYSEILIQPNKIEIQNPDFIKGYGKSQYNDEFISYMASFVSKLGLESRNIIFSPTTKQARTTAVELSKTIKTENNDPHLQSLVTYLKETVHEDYDLSNTIVKGFAYHHGKVPTHVRSVLEKAIKDKMINNVICTTTLMQGVNLPAQNIIVRNPNLAIKSKDGIKPKLTDYEMANLRGRAGRLLKDFIGRTYVLEEIAFEKDNDQLELFPEAEKNLQAGYGKKYETHKKKIDQCLVSNIAPSDDNKEYSFLITYIRQIILKHKNNSAHRLNSVGIDIDSSLLKEIENSLSNLSIPEHLCYINRYWDPLDLNTLYKKRDEFSIPTSISDRNIATSLSRLILKIKNTFPIYFYRYTKLDNDRLIFSACISAEKWLKEKPLKEILSARYIDSPDKLENQISLIQNQIAYGIPMLLKPLYDMKVPDNMFLRFIEIGAFMPITRKMIELNIPRETAIYLTNNYFSDFSHNEHDLESIITKRLFKIKDNLSYWNKIQIETLI
ncbi:DEAD/DEAH box helicase [uncultured Draconibacterium sp.]|uniref:DEAD/DEAH box helicase n=1 Tax=uncultured Draconibacterium sp. TaxID=1573823 RepID=UPI003216FD77